MRVIFSDILIFISEIFNLKIFAKVCIIPGNQRHFNNAASTSDHHHICLFAKKTSELFRMAMTFTFEIDLVVSNICLCDFGGMVVENWYFLLLKTCFWILQFLALAAKRVHDEMYLPKVLLFAAVSHMTMCLVTWLLS